MRKLLLSFALVVGLGLAANAQKEGPVNKVSLGAEFAFPTGGLAELYGYGYGASLQGEYNLLPNKIPNLNVTASVGYLELAYSKLYKGIWEPWMDTKIANTVIYPVKAGAKYYFGKRYYGAGEVGAAVTTEKGRSTALSFAGGLGTSLAVSAKSSVDVGARFEVWSMNGTTGFVGLRAAYAFGF